MKEINSNLWPFIEAKKVLKRFQNNDKEYCIFQTGYGPSGLPHIGTFGEVLRTSMVIKAFKKLTDQPVKLFVFSDDMDGLRKVPKNVPNQDLIKQHLEKPLSSIPDPFQEFASFSEHNNNKLISFLKKFNFDFEFKSATHHYKNGIFNEGLDSVLLNYEKILNVILPTLGKERRETYSPFLPICQQTGKVLQVKIEEINKNSKTLVYVHPESNKKVETSIFDGHCKLQWKVDWAMRWYVLGIDYEMNGKDLIESFQLSNKINRIIGGRPPNNFTYELFLDQNGEKISKSIGNGISVDDWLEFSPLQSLELFMFHNPNRAKRLYFDVIPKMTDEFLKYNKDYVTMNEDNQMQSPLWFVNNEVDQKVLNNLSFSLILNLASVCNADTPDILWGFIENYYGRLEKEKYPYLTKLLEFGIAYYNKFVLPVKKYREPNDKEILGFKKLIKSLKEIDEDTEAEDIQTVIYDIGMSLKFDSLKEWFTAFYQVILGQDQGPRLGSFIKFYGVKRTINLVEEKLSEDS